MHLRLDRAIDEKVKAVLRDAGIHLTRPEYLDMVLTAIHTISLTATQQWYLDHMKEDR